MKKGFLLIAVMFALGVFSPVQADGIYGNQASGSPTAALLVDKTVSRGNTTKGGIMEYVDNFSASDARFSATDRVYFQIRVKNTSNTVLKNVQMQDILPEYIDAIEGPGDYNATNRIIAWSYSELRPGEERTEKLILQIKPQAQLPSDRGTFCVNNKAVGKSGDYSDEDSAQFCIEKLISMTQSGVPTQSPKAGAEFGLIFGALNIAGLGAGIYVRRRT